MASDAHIRNNPNLRGREAYEASVKAIPRYDDGAPRPTWEQLSELKRWSWERPAKGRVVAYG